MRSLVHQLLPRAAAFKSLQENSPFHWQERNGTRQPFEYPVHQLFACQESRVWFDLDLLCRLAVGVSSSLRPQLRELRVLRVCDDAHESSLDAFVLEDRSQLLAELVRWPTRSSGLAAGIGDVSSKRNFRPIPRADRGFLRGFSNWRHASM